jgi:hypothetical protein
MHRPAKDPGAVVIALSGDADANERAPQTWPSMAADMCRRWVVCRAQVGVGGSEQCAVQIDNPAPGILAAIRYQKGFWAVPSSNANLQIAGMDFSQPVPLVAGTSLCLAGTMLQISAPQTQAPAHAVSNPQHRHAG